MPSPTKRQLAAAARTAGMDPLFELSAPPSPPTAPAMVGAAETAARAIPDPGSADELPRVVADQRLPHPNPHGCLHCTNRATLLLTLVMGSQVATCRPHTSRYPR
jgi:hypothetical protein